MKTLLVLSGKGGTGKTTITSALIKLFECSSYADCDVDAPNLELVTSIDSLAKLSNFYGMDKAEINQNLCIQCGLCASLCKFNAINIKENIMVNKLNCEGCGLCEAFCKQKAIKLVPDIAGELKLFKHSEKVFSTAKLKTGSGTSGKLVSEVKKQLYNNIDKSSFTIIDGSPGIGCPIISSISGVDIVLIVAEPSLSGSSDMKRVIKLAQTFQTPVVICVNKYNINLDITDDIITYCKENSLSFLGLIPYDSKVLEANNQGKSIVDYDCEARNAIIGIYKKLVNIINHRGEKI